MSKSKKYYWLKLKEDFFADPKVKKLRRIAGGDTYTVIYLKMMLLSIKSGGVIEFHGIEKTLHEELSLILDEDEVNVNATLIYLEKMSMIESCLEQSYLLKNIPELIGSESDSKERVQRFRDKQKQIGNVTCNADVTVCNENVTTEKREKIEERREQEIRQDNNKKEKAPSFELPNFINPDIWAEWVQYRKEIKKPLTPSTEKGQIKKLVEFDRLGMDTSEVIRASIDAGYIGLFALRTGKKYQPQQELSPSGQEKHTPGEWARILKQEQLDKQNINDAEVL